MSRCSARVALGIALGFAAAPDGRADEPKAGELVVEAAKVGSYSAERGRLFVPENRANPKSRLIELAFVRLKSSSESPKAPLVYLAGGPGSPATPMAEEPRWDSLLRHFDVIFLDQRGTGASRPSLAWTPPKADPARCFGDWETFLGDFVEGTRALAQHLREQGIDVAGYTTVENARDVEDLRRALRLETIGLLGHSYGTHLGLEIVRKFGAHVDRFVALGTAGMNDMYKLPLDVDAALERLSKVIAADPQIGKEVPDFALLLEQVIARAEETPFEVAVEDSARGKPVPVEVGPFGIQMVVLRDLADVSDLPILPRLLSDLLRGETAILEWFVQKRYDGMRALDGMQLAMRGASGATKERWARVDAEGAKSLFGRARLIVPREVNAALGTPDLGDAFRAPVKSDVRALFVSGTLDAATPPEQAEAVRKGFSRGAHFVVENAGHEDLLAHRDVRTGVLRFLTGEEVKDARFTAPALRFVPLAGFDSPVGHPALEHARRKASG